MKRKLLLLLAAILYGAFVFSQEVSLSPQKLTSKQELHGVTTIVPNAEPGSTRAIGDDCTTPIVISIPADAPYTDLSQTNCGRGNTYSNTCLSYYDGGEDIIYRLDVTADGTLDITMDPKGTTWTGILIADDCPDVGNCLDYNTGSGGTRSMTDVSVTAGNSYYIMVDTWPSPNCIPDFDLTISYTAPPACPAPTDQTESNITTSGADLGWTDASGSHWDIYVVASGGAAPTQTTTPTADDVTSTSYTYAGGSAATTYDWYVRSDCDQDNVGTSTWTGPSTYTTACPTVTSFPYTTDFENGGSIANCWTNDPADAGGEWMFATNDYHGPTADHTTGSGYYALLDDYLTQDYDSPFNLLTPVFDLSTPNKWYKVSYWAWIGPDGANNPIYFEVSLDGGTTWKTLYTHDHSITETWFKTSIDLGFNKSANVVFRYRGMSIYGYSTDNSGIDDFTIEETQAPPVPLSDWAIYAGVLFILSFLVIRFRRRLA